MNIARNLIAVVLGLIAGSAVNMGIVVAGPALIPPPPGVDVMNPDSIAASINLFEPKHFLAPFLAHALGTLVGALLAWRVAGSRKTQMALIVGAFFLAGGIYASTVIPAPAWFIATDVLLAYLPMAWLAARLAGGIGPGGDNMAAVAE